MISNINLFGISIPIYGICFYFGIFAAALAGMIICKYKKFPRWELIYSGIYAMIGALIGSKLLFVIVSYQDIIKYNLSIIQIIKGGFVFYGGFLGGLCGIVIYTAIYREKLLPYLDIFAAVVPLGHSIGRIGCHFAGCCYGIPCSFGIIYDHSAGITPLGIRLLPIQLIESTCLFILFAVTVSVFIKSKEIGITTAVYMISYSVIRFVIEFFRGDTERGAFLGFSTSQWICFAVLLITVICIVHQKSKNIFKSHDN